MFNCKLTTIFAWIFAMALGIVTTPAHGNDAWICEKVTQSGKHKVLKKIKSKRRCLKIKGAEWIKKDHDHDHSHDHDHDHD